MRHGLHTLLKISLLSFVAAGQPAASPVSEAQQALDECVAHVFATQYTVFEDAPLALDSVCPQLDSQLDKQVFTRLQPSLQTETTFRQLHDAQRSLASFAPAAPGSRYRFDHSRLAELLEEVYEPETRPEPSSNFIDKFWSWVDEKLRDYFDDEDNWLTRNFNITPEKDSGLFKGIVYTLVVILIVTILYIIINELRAANVLSLFKRRHRRRIHKPAGNQSVPATSFRHLADIGGLPLNQQASALLGYTIQFLIERQLLPRQYSLTNREFLAVLTDRLPGAAASFEKLVSTGEQVIYGKRDLPAESAALLFEQVRHIEQTPRKGST